MSLGAHGTGESEYSRSRHDYRESMRDERLVLVVAFWSEGSNTTRDGVGHAVAERQREGEVGGSPYICLLL